MKKRKGLQYGIDFDTKEMPSKIVVVTVALDTMIMGPKDAVAVNLCEHPLYDKLCTYVRNNPPGKAVQNPVRKA